MSDSVVKEGWLWKWTNFLQGYQKRWCVISEGTLSYYRIKEEVNSTCRGTIVLANATVIIENSYSFVVSNGPAHIFHLKVSVEEELSPWIAALENAKDQNKDKFKVKMVISGIDNDMATSNNLQDNLEVLSNKLSGANECITQIKLYNDEMCRLINGDMDSDPDSNLHLQVKNAIDFLSSSLGTLNNVRILFKSMAENISNEETINDDNSEPDEFTLAPEFIPTENGENLKTYRQSIPIKPTYGLNLWSLMKNNINKELWRIPLPVNFNEPLSMLQRFSEDMEYCALLDKAASCTDSHEQMTYVVAFTVSGYSTTRYRSGKPFNPLLGETFECDRKDLGYKLISEQVSHHPPISAFHSDSQNGLWSFWITLSLESKFYGNYLNATPTGTYHCLFHKSGNHYTWKKVTTSIHNIIIGKLWIDQFGECTVTNHTTGDTCLHSYTPYKFFSQDQFREVNGVVRDKNHKAYYVIKGLWDKHMDSYKIVEENNPPTYPNPYKLENPTRLWTTNVLPKDSSHMYNFTSLSISLNEMEEGVAPTDSRMRPDQRQMENADWDLANSTKEKLENLQRKRKREIDADNIERTKQGLPELTHKPLWFRKATCPITKEEIYKYNGKYWESKKLQKWDECLDIFSI